MVLYLKTRLHGDELKHALSSGLTHELHTVPRYETEDIVPYQGDEVNFLWRRNGTTPVEHDLPIVETARLWLDGAVGVVISDVLYEA
jgi:hypothetical protein